MGAPVAEDDDRSSGYSASIMGAGDRPHLAEENAVPGDYEVDVPQEFVEGDVGEAEVSQEVLHEEFEEKVERIGLPKPLQPTAFEVAEHNISHVPYRSWCEHCVRGKARTSAHPTSAGAKLADQRPTIAMDYFYLGKKEDDSLPILGVVEETSQRCFSLTLPSKGLTHQYNLAVLSRVIKVLGVQFGVLKSDTERALVALRDAVQAKFPNLSVENATKGESASNGLIEATIGKMESQARTLKSALQARYGIEIGPKHAILPWLVDYAGATLSRYARGADGRTPYERSARKPWRLKVPEFGECIWYQPLKGEKVGSKLEPKFEKGIFLGVQEGSALKWIGTDAGVVRAWSIKRRPEDERWMVDELNHLIGLPWQLKPPAEASKKLDVGGEIDLQVAVDDPPSEPLVVREKRKKGYVPRGIYIRKDVELQQFGYTPGCDGCIAAERGLGHRQHSSTCKERIAAELEKTSEGKMRLELIRKREEEHIVNYHEAEERKRKAETSPGASSKTGRADEPSLEDIILAHESQGASSSHPGVAAGPGSPVEMAPAGLLPADAPPGGDASMDDGGGEDVPAMDVGALEVLCKGDGLKRVDPDFVGCLREASYLEAMDLLADEDVSKVKLELQKGILSVAAAYGLTKPEVAELYSPPRVTDFGKKKGILSGVAFDLTTNDEDGNPWDFCLESQRQKAAQKIEEQQPDLVVGSPMCAPCSNLQNLNMRTPEGQAKVQQKEEEGDQHLEFCAQQYEAQMARGGYFLHEHPWSARSWKRPCMQRLAARDDVYVVTGDLCRYGLQSEDEWGVGLAKKATNFMTNSPEIAKELSLRCTNQHQAMGVWKEFN